jgi:hypothetical protein|tara:strand:- start:136 stop:354 length:219 start_codon:yes stop_codon:yes gene_type:complete
MFDTIKEMVKDLSTGLGIMAVLGIVIYAYGYMITSLGLSETYETALIFAPIVLYASYMMGGLRRLNRNTKTF